MTTHRARGCCLGGIFLGLDGLQNLFDRLLGVQGLGHIPGRLGELLVGAFKDTPQVFVEALSRAGVAEADHAPCLDVRHILLHVEDLGQVPVLAGEDRLYFLDEPTISSIAEGQQTSAGRLPPLVGHMTSPVGGTGC